MANTLLTVAQGPHSGPAARIVRLNRQCSGKDATSLEYQPVGRKDFVVEGTRREESAREASWSAAAAATAFCPCPMRGNGRSRNHVSVSLLRDGGANELLL